MFLAATSTVSAMAAIGEVSTAVITSIWPYLLIAIGIPLAFYFAKKLIGLLPKHK
jgi:predicted RND superfamily exporter protein